MSGLMGLTGTDNGIVGGQHSIRSKVVYYDRTVAETTASTNVQEVLTGAGFTPVACIFLGSNFYFGFGGGFAAVKEDGTIVQGTSTARNQAAAEYSRSDNENMYRQSAGSSEIWYCRMVNFTADGANVEFYRGSSNSSGLTYAIMWLR
jgi:hypothetical protein